jgi:predicted RNase H-like nuclease (RuvC/YqgF family)
MELTKQFEACAELSNIIKVIDFTKLIEYVKELEEENKVLKITLENTQKELEQKTNDLSNLTKVSMVQNLNKQVNEKNNYITILESQLEKYRNVPKKEGELLHVKENIPLQKEEVDFDPDNFEEINGYELMLYKKNYYLRDLETNELYNIVNNKPDSVVGFINNKGKPKFNS